MKIPLMLKVLTTTLLLVSCAETQNKSATLNIQPFQEVQHSYEQAKAEYELGRYYHGQLRYSQAIEAYRQALAMNPGMVDALNALGAAYAESGNLVLARQQFEAALKLQPQSVYTYNNLGFVNYLAGDYPAAVQAYKQALRQDPGHEKARQNLVLAYAKMGRDEQIARTEVPAKPVPVRPLAKKAGQTAWVKVSPVIYEMRTAGAPAERAVAMPATKVADAVPVARAATIDSAPAVPVVAQPVATKPSAIVEPKKGHLAFETSSLQGVEISNGNGIRGMAARVARYFSGKGIQQARLTNQKPFDERRTRIEYRPGSGPEAARVNKFLPRAAPLVASSSLRPDIRVRLVLGHDLGDAMTAWDSQPETGSLVAGLSGMELPNL